MPTRKYEDLVAPIRDSWKPEVVELSRRLGSQLNAEREEQIAFGRRIADALESAQLSQPQLATRSGVQQADISRIERGLGNPTRDTLLKLADALEMRLVLQPKKASRN